MPPHSLQSHAKPTLTNNPTTPHAPIGPPCHTRECQRSCTCPRPPIPPAHTLCARRAAYALGFLNCDDISARCMLSIFQFFATKTGEKGGVAESVQL
jgi:hypothetical protein